MLSVVAVIPTYRPDAGALLDLVDALISSGVDVLVADDASPCTADAALRSVNSRGVRVTRHARNAGIARSLNAGLLYARERGAAWLLTVDQDSVLPRGYVDELACVAETVIHALGVEGVGAVAAGAVDDASGELGYPVTYVRGVPTTEEVIQTGTLWSVAGLIAAGGFDTSLGIDAVDAAACLRLREQGMRVVLAPGIRIGHRLGAGRQVTMLGRSVLASGHDAGRRTTMVRNRLRLAPAEFRQSPKHALRTLRRLAVNTLLAVTIEDERWAKAKGSARGLMPRRQR